MNRTKCLLAIILSIFSIVTAEAQFKYTEDKDWENIYLKQLKPQDARQIVVYRYYNETEDEAGFGAYKYNNLYYAKLLNKKYETFLYVYNPIDSSLNKTSDFQFSYIVEEFFFKDNFYFIVSEPDRARKSYVSIIQINHKNPFRSKHYSFRLMESSSIFTKGSTGKPNRSIAIDSNGNLKLRVNLFNMEINWDNLLHFWSRGYGPIWEPNSETSIYKWYVFDDDLNLLYTEDENDIIIYY